MDYPVIIHKDKNTSYGVTIPDFPSVFTTGDSIEEALSNVQKAIELFYDGEKSKDVPNPSNIDSINKELLLNGGKMMFAEVNFDFIKK